MAGSSDKVTDASTADASTETPLKMGNVNLTADVSLRRWFILYGLLMGGLVMLSIHMVDRQDARFHEELREFGRISKTVKPWHKMLLAEAQQVVELAKAAAPDLKLTLLIIYLALATTFFPLPTGAMIAAMSTRAAGLSDNVFWLVLLVSFFGAAASTLANLTDYHVFLWLLRHRRIAKLRDTKTYKAAAKWFAKGPFAIMVIFNIIHIPVDIPRMLAAIYGYSRKLFALSNFIGRFARYAIIVVVTVMLPAGYDWVSPLFFLVLAIAIAMTKLGPPLARRVFARKKVRFVQAGQTIEETP